MRESTKFATAAMVCMFLAACGGGSCAPASSPKDTVASGEGSDKANNRPSSSTFAVDATARFNHPTDLVLDNAGNLFVSDEGNQLIRKISRSGEVSTLPENTLYQSTLSVTQRSSKLAIDPANNLFILSPYFGDDIGELIRPAYAVHKLAPNGTKTLIANYWTEAALRTYIPLSISTDAQGRLYTLTTKDSYYLIERHDPNGSHDLIVDYHSRTAGHLEQFASDAHGNIAFIAKDYGVGEVAHRLFTLPTSLQLGTAMVGGDNDRTLAASASHFDAIVYESNGDIYTADVLQDADQAYTAIRIMKITPDGQTTTIYQGFPDGSTARRPSTPTSRERMGMVRAANGDLYITDPHLHAVYKITSSGQASLVAGKPGKAGNSD